MPESSTEFAPVARAVPRDVERAFKVRIPAENAILPGDRCQGVIEHVVPDGTREVIEQHHPLAFHCECSDPLAKFFAVGGVSRPSELGTHDDDRNHVGK